MKKPKKSLTINENPNQNSGLGFSYARFSQSITANARTPQKPRFYMDL